MVLLIGGVYYCHYYLSGEEAKEWEEEIFQKKSLIEQGKKVIGEYSENYEIKTEADIEVGVYNDYTFEIDNETYAGRVELYEPPTDFEVEIYYLPSDPSVNSIYPKADLQEAENSADSKGTLWFSIGMMVVGFVGALITLISMKRKGINRLMEE